uniref:SH3 domain-containing protein n=1 Tax=Timema monikensis TaxID=170555 RepID=A0A7R9HP25_9NEOP|nr:unnamed protein product [Timema monikensis]
MSRFSQPALKYPLLSLFVDFGALLLTFEDKRKENFDKGQAELERRRKALLDIQRKEQEERERKEKEEMEKRERIRLEQERRRQQELEKQLQKQREMEQEKEEQRRRAQEQRDAARRYPTLKRPKLGRQRGFSSARTPERPKQQTPRYSDACFREMERQRQLEWEKQRCQELQHQRQREQEKVLSLKAKNQNLSIELSQLNEKVKELSHKISETRLGVSGVKTTIDGMRSTRDQQMADMSALKTRLKEQNQRLVSLGQEKARMEAKNRMNSATDNANQEQVAIAFSNKQITLKQMRDRLNDLQKEIEVKLSDIENNNSQLGDLKKQLATLVQECEQLYAVYEERKRRVLEMKGVTNRQKESSDLGTSWGETGWNTAPQTTWNTDTDTADTEWASTAADTTIPGRSLKASLHGAGAKLPIATSSSIEPCTNLWQEMAMNSPFSLVDIIMVPVVQNAEPGWLAGEIRGHTGWFPESYVEPVDGTLGTLALEGSIGDAAPAFPPDIIGDTLQGKRPLEGIAEVPENVSDNGSVAEIVGEAGPQITDLASPVLGQGELVDNVQAQALYTWSARRGTHLSFNKGDIITVKEQQELWWFGELNGAQGWFPSNYVQVVALEGTQDADFEQEYHVTLYPYNSVESGDLSFQQGEVVLVVKKEGDWWTGVIGDRQGIFPSNYVQKAEIETQIPAEEIVPNVVELVAKEEVAAVVETPPVAVQAQPLQQEQPPPPSPLPAAKTPTPGTPDFAAMSAQSLMDSNPSTLGMTVTLQHKCPVYSGHDGCPPAQVPGCFSFGFASVFSFSELEVSLAGFHHLCVQPNSYDYVLHQTGKSKKPEIATVIAPYQATSTEQLTLQRGQLIMVRKKTTTGWWEGELQAKGRKRQIGWFPASYVKLLGGGAKGRQDDQPSPLPTLQPSPSPQPQASSLPTQQNNIEKVVALYQYAAQNEDELSFEKDDVIVLLAKEEPSWSERESTRAHDFSRNPLSTAHR